MPMIPPLLPLCQVDAGELARWVEAIPFEDWPQQHRLADGAMRPAMVTDLGWHEFGQRTDDLVCSLSAGLGEPHTRMLSVVMPGAHIDAHRDEQPPDWVTRVHVPLATNDRAVMIMAGVLHHLAVGTAYLVDTRVEHAIVNDGPTPRIHLMFDVRRS